MKRRLDYQLDLPIFTEPEVVWASALDGYRDVKAGKAQVQPRRFLASLPDPSQGVLPLEGMADSFEAGSDGDEILPTESEAFDIASACASHKVPLLVSSSGIGQKQLDLDLQILPQTGA